MQLIADSVGLSDAQLQLIHQNEDHASGELVENNLTSYPLPEGVVTGLIVNGRRHLVPMVTEEPSVIAAASNGAKLLSAGEGIHCAIPEKLVSGQVIVKHAEIKAVSKFVETNRQQILNIANQSHPSILKYGRGAQKVAVRELSPTFLSIDLSVDTGEAMGANIINTMLEAISNWLSDQLHVETTMAILSNFADEEVVEVTGQVAVDKLASRSLDGRQVAQRIADASEVAQLDVKRATTHNKGL